MKLKHKSEPILALALLVLPFASVSAQGPDPKLDELVEKLMLRASASLQEKAKQGSLTCIVLDFREVEGKPTRLGVELATEFTASLKRKSGQIEVLDRPSSAPSLGQAGPESSKTSLDQAAAAYARSIGANMSAVGEVSKRGESLNLVVALLDAQGNRLAEASGTLERTFYRKSMEELSPRPLNPFPHWPGVPVAGKNGYGEPKCVSCPMSHYTSDARAAGFQGTELVYLLVGEDGSVKDVFVAEGLPGGLSDQTVSTLKTWRFEPVHGPDGKPVTVQVPVDAVFQLIREKSRCLSCPPVRYTKEARKAKVEGTLTLKLLVDKEGNVREVNVEQGLPHGLTEQAVDTVKKWKFKPFLGPDGNPIEKSLDIELNFRLPR